ncbi:hypothetical protein K435DRAFT_844829 [Dendrothele bispora CBS 962.96]|uniref:DUF6533 domain-containing protein n=1 Tax=Dendrothele bispora (strain CBS 962.96) TaxID=1314807 RepID=A0A4V4HBY0_DENBC|nr:hypothetical protein K435DRAFT_844829 [Dendrothele bispora CBS 962.96]
MSSSPLVFDKSFIDLYVLQRQRQYLCISSLVVIVYDILNNLEDELELILRHKIQFPTVIYTIARLSCLSSVSVNTAYVFGLNVKYCQLQHFFTITLFVIGINSIALLFLLRARAIFHDVPRIQLSFTFLWVLVFGSSTLNFFHTRTVRSLVEPEVCTEEHVEPFYTAVSIGMLLVFDTIVYIAISYRLFQTFLFHERNRPVFQRTCILLNGATLPTFSRSLFRDGQLYYLISLLTGSTVFLLYVLPSLHAQYGAISVPLYIVSTNIIACWVFRNAKLGRIRELEVSTSIVVSRVSFRRQGEQERLPARSFLESSGDGRE